MNVARLQETIVSETIDQQFSERVMRQLSPDTRGLWGPIADNFVRNGPDAVRTYLDSERDRLEDAVIRSFNSAVDS